MNGAKIVRVHDVKEVNREENYRKDYSLRMIELFKIGFIKVSLIDIIDILLVTWIFYKAINILKKRSRSDVNRVNYTIDCFIFI